MGGGGGGRFALGTCGDTEAGLGTCGDAKSGPSARRVRAAHRLGTCG